MRRLTPYLLAWLLVVVVCGSASARDYQLQITNKTGSDVSYRYRIDENTGGQRPYVSGTVRAGSTVTLTYSSSLDYGIVLRFADDQGNTGRLIHAQFGPYEIREDKTVYDAQGRVAREERISDD